MTFCISANCLSSWFTSDTFVPEPAAMRLRRDPLISVGSARSALVIDPDRARHWIKNGARPTATARSLLVRSGLSDSEVPPTVR